VKIDIVTIFPAMVTAPLAEGIVARAIAKGLIDVGVHDLRDFTTDRHRVVDDMPFGGGPGMVLKPEPLFAAVEAIQAKRPVGRHAIVLTSPDGERLTHGVAARLSGLDHLVILCGRYEGVDERVIQARGLEEVSLGDFVLSGGEPAAIALIDACVRLLPGVLGAEETLNEESFERGLLEYPHYTRPAEWAGLKVPEVLLSGHHEKIQAWRRSEAERTTRERRPDLWSRYQAA